MKLQRNADETLRSCNQDRKDELYRHYLQLGKNLTEVLSIIQSIYLRLIRSLMTCKNEEHLLFLNTIQKQKYKELKSEKFSQLNLLE